MKSKQLHLNTDSEIFTVSKINDYIQYKLETDLKLKKIWVKGEISNLTRHSNGRLYFTLKDELSQISCVMFNDSSSLNFEPEQGMKVLLLSSIGVYKPYGKYQLIVSEMQPDGLGALHQRFLQLKEKLEKEGLFSQEHKRNLPKFPKTIGIITSPTGAVIRDLITNLTRRFPSINIKFSPSLVQGTMAPESIVKSIQLLNKQDIDIIILARGGGSLEDLWCFNEEVVARAIFNSRIPIISAIGHETDFTIADFVADIRASTPSTATEIAVPDKNELLIYLSHLNEKLLIKTKRIIEPYLQRIDELMLRFSKAISNKIKQKKAELEILKAKLHNLDPKAVLSRGYSIVMKEEKIIKDSSHLKIDESLDVIFYKGKIKSRIVEVKDGKE